MATTDHPLVLDLGDVRGPSGIAGTDGTPSASEGRNGEMRIDPETGTIYKKANGTWSAACTVLLAPLDTEIDDESTNGVTNAAIAAALADKIPATRTQADVSGSFGGTGNYVGSRLVMKYGPLGYINISQSDSIENTWTRTIVVGGKASADAIFTLPDGFRCGKTEYTLGHVLTTDGNRMATFTILSNGDSTRPNEVLCTSILDGDFNRIRDVNDQVVSQFVVSGYSIGFWYRIAGV